jgi:G3E family GTPase
MVTFPLRCPACRHGSIEHPGSRADVVFLHGSICCNLVGQLSDALVSLKADYVPARIVIETSGSAFPATLALVRGLDSRGAGSPQF